MKLNWISLRVRFTQGTQKEFAKIVHLQENAALYYTNYITIDYITSTKLILILHGLMKQNVVKF